MGWNYREPNRSDYETEEDYREALDAYDAAECGYIDDYHERKMEE